MTSFQIEWSNDVAKAAAFFSPTTYYFMLARNDEGFREISILIN